MDDLQLDDDDNDIYERDYPVVLYLFYYSRFIAYEMKGPCHTTLD